MVAADLVLLARGLEAEVFLRSDGSVLKLMYDPANTERVGHEATALRTLSSHGYPAPELLDVVTVDGRPGLVLQRVPGSDLLTQLGRNPLALLRAGRALGDVHAAMHQIEAPAGLPDRKDIFRRRIEAAPDLPDRLRAAAVALLAELPAGDRLCHGDLHLGNLLGSWSAPIVIDWGDASHGDPLADVARTYLVHQVASAPPGAPPLVRMLAPAVRTTIARRYLAAYRKHHRVDQKLLGQWMTVGAAARLAEPVPGEYPKLIQLIESRISGTATR
jgi:uncharacterized protein (TIGR02172 family)